MNIQKFADLMIILNVISTPERQEEMCEVPSTTVSYIYVAAVFISLTVVPSKNDNI